MNRSEPGNLLSLPNEVIQSILTLLPAHQIPSLQLVCRRFAQVASEPSLWRNCCISSFRWWHPGHHLRDRLEDPSSTDWKQLYADRHLNSKQVRSALNAILDSETGRLPQLQKIINAAYDAKDVLLEFYGEAKGSPKHLAQRFVLPCFEHMISMLIAIKILESCCPRMLTSEISGSRMAQSEIWRW
jgi:F-box protein 21